MALILPDMVSPGGVLVPWDDQEIANTVWQICKAIASMFSRTLRGAR